MVFLSSHSWPPAASITICPPHKCWSHEQNKCLAHVSDYFCCRDPRSDRLCIICGSLRSTDSDYIVHSRTDLGSRARRDWLCIIWSESVLRRPPHKINARQTHSATDTDAQHHTHTQHTLKRTTKDQTQGSQERMDVRRRRCVHVYLYIRMYVCVSRHVSPLLPMEELSIQIISIVRVLIDVCTSIRFVRLICTIYNGGTVNSKRNEPRSPPPVSLTCLCQRKETCQTSERNDPHERFLLRKSDTNSCRSSLVERSFLFDRVLSSLQETINQSDINKRPWSCRLYKRPCQFKRPSTKWSLQETIVRGGDSLLFMSLELMDWSWVDGLELKTINSRPSTQETWTRD